MTRGVIGSRNLNIELQKALNPNPSNFVDKFGWTFCVGDKIMQIENNYDKQVFNGDIGFIQHIDKEESLLVARFDKQDIEYDFNELDEIVLAYATTVHKSQGSEYPVVILPIMMSHYPMLQKNLVYTGITRGKQLVITVGQKKALALAIKNTKNAKRWSTLRTRIIERSQFIKTNSSFDIC